MTEHVERSGPISRASSGAAAKAIASEVAMATGLAEPKVVRVLDGALRSAADAHGPIVGSTVASAAKRAVAQLRSDGLWRPPAPG
jgi:hypothetical protein